MNKNELVSFGMGIFVGFILLSMYFSSDILTGHITILVTLIAVSLTSWTLSETRRHNRLSVKPKLSTHNNLNNTNVSYTLTNKGLGTAHLYNIEFYYCDKLVDADEFHKRQKRFFMKNAQAESKSLFTHLYKTMDIAKDEKIVIFDVFKPKNINTEMILNEYATQFKMIINYQCIYEEKQPELNC